MVEFQLLSGILAKKGGDFDPADIFTGNMMGTGFEQKNPVAVFQFRDAGGPGQISVEIAFMVCQNNACLLYTSFSLSRALRASL